ncbi:MFS transporter [Bacillus gobiensis]|uniref:MFS transporter n=1 Tax=Bacillus gobiensis TaxID=1441095 RepID=UPI003D1A9D76
MKNLLKKNMNYRFLWFAQSGSYLGDWFNQVALAQTVLIFTNSASAVGILLLCRALPSVILGPILSPFVDKYPKKPILVISDMVRAVLVLSFIIAFIYNSTWILYVNSFIMGIMSVLYVPANQAMLPSIVSREDLTEANAFSSATSGIVSIIGAIAGGIVSAILSPITCFLINSLSYLWSAFYILKIKYNEETATQKQSASYLKSLKEGFIEASRNNIVRSIILIGLSWGLAGGGYYILIPILGNNVYDMGGLGIGILYSIDGLGVIVGAYIVKRYIGDKHKRALVGFGIAYIIQAISLALLAQFSIFYLGAIFLFLMRVSSGVIIPLSTYLVQTSTEENIRGRIFTLYGSSYSGVMQLSYVISGLAFENFRLSLVGGIIGFVSFLCGVIWLTQILKGKFDWSLK